MSDSEIEQNVLEFDFPLPAKQISSNLVRRHAEISSLLKVPEDLMYIFSTVASLCDPFTQPEENDRVLLSVDCIADLLISISYSRYVMEKPENGEEKDVDGESEEDEDGENDTPEDSETPEEPLDINSIKFDLSTKYFTLLRSIHSALNADDELTMRYLNNDELHYLENIPQWTPPLSLAHDEFNLRIVYSIACVLILSIYKLFKPKENPEEYNLTLNPYLHYFLKLWKCHTNIVLLGLEIDRRIEFDNHENDAENETPQIVKLTLKGSSSVRYILSWIINQNPSSLYEEDPEMSAHNDEDIKNESLLNFIQPLGRKKVNGGSLSIDMRLVIIALLILNSGTSFIPGQFSIERPSLHEDEAQRRLNQSKPLTELGDILIDLEYDDRFDEDIRYIFEYEYDGDSEDDVDSENEHGHDHENEHDHELDLHSHNGVTKEADSEKDWLDEDEHAHKVMKKERKKHETDQKGPIKGSTAVRTNVTIEFDEFGRDWRDLPRGGNEKYQPWFLEKLAQFESLSDKTQSDFFFATWNELYVTFEFLSTNSIEGEDEAEKRVGQVLINSIAKAIKDEIDKKEDLAISPDKIYQYWFSSATEEGIQATQENNKQIVPVLNITKFELFFHNNNKLARCLMDEMLMCEGYRRVLIWFLTHNVNLSTLLIDYVYQLLTGMRGDAEKQSPYLFTRMGDKLVLSEVEQSMLLHEFLTNCNIYLSATEGIPIESGYKVVLAESIALKYVSVLCLMIDHLILKGVIDLESERPVDADDDINDYRLELQNLLVHWVGKLPEARKLFFKVTSMYKEKAEKESAKMDNATLSNLIANETKTSTSNEAIPDGLSVSFEAQEKLFEKYSEMSTLEISQDLQSNDIHLILVSAFITRMSQYIKQVLGTAKKTGESPPAVVHRQFAFFFAHFNTLCKVEVIAETLFDTFESSVSTGIEAVESVEVSKDNEVSEDIPELVTDSTADEASSKKSKKKNKKKNKKKK